MRTGERLVARSDELRQIARARKDGAGGVVLVGEPGVGKTRLALAGLAEAEAAGAVTVRAVATRAAAAIPLGALAPLLPELTAGVNPLVAGRRAVHALAHERPLVMVVDDAHLLDDISATLILQVAASRKAFAIVTVRAGSRVAEPITGLWKDGHAERIELHPLANDSVDELVSTLLDGDVVAVEAFGQRAVLAHQPSRRSRAAGSHVAE